MTHEAILVEANDPGTVELNSVRPATSGSLRRIRAIPERIRVTPAATRVPWIIMSATTLVILYNSWRLRSDRPASARIYDQYLLNFEHGHGLVYEAGRRFDAMASPLYAYLMVVVDVVVRNPVDASWIVAVTTMIGAAWFLFRFGDRRGNGLGYSLGLLVGFALPCFYLTYGMDTGLVLLVIAAGLYLFETGRCGWLAFCAALLIITRAEIALLLVPIAVERFIRRQRFPHPKTFIAPLLILAAHFTFEWLYYGDLLPSTDLAKAGQGGGSGPLGTQSSTFLNVGYFRSTFFSHETWLWTSLLLLALVGAVAQWRKLRPLLIFSLLYVGLCSTLNIPDYLWYYAPLLFCGCVFVGCGMETLARASRSTRRSVRSSTSSGL